MPPELAQNLLDEDVSPMEKTDKKEDPLKKPDEKAQGEQIDERKLSPKEVDDLKEKRITMPQLIAKREQLKAAAQSELKGLVRDQTVVDLNEFSSLRKAIEEEESPEKMQKIIDRIKEIPKNKAEDAKNLKKERSPEDPELIKLQEKFDTLCDKNKDALEDPKKFKDWFAEERRKTPTIEHLQKLLNQNENDENGDTIAKRATTYNKLKEKFKKYGISEEPTKNDWIKNNGLEEREAFLKGISNIEKHFETRKDTGFYSREMIQTRMKENLLANPTELKQRLIQAENIASKEDEGFTYLDKPIEIQGLHIKQMSDASKKELLDYYKNATFADREKADFKALVEHEGKLAKELEGVYTDEKTKICDKEGLHKALGTFEKMDFLQKQKAIEDHKELVKDKSNKEAADNVETKGKALLAINKAFTDNNISQITKGKYEALFNDPTKFKNKKTGKPGDSEEMKKAYETLISPTPIKEKENRNLKAYEIQRDLFLKDIEKLKKLNPDISEEEIKKWQDKYDKGTWSDREHIQKTEFPSELFKQELEAKKREKLDEKAGLNKSDKKEAEVISLEFMKVRKAAYEFLGNDQGLEALQLVMKYAEKDRKNPEVIKLLQVVNAHIQGFGLGESSGDTMEEKTEDEMERMAQSDEHVRQGLQKAQAFERNLKGAKMSEERHNRKIDATERSQEESLSHIQSGTVEADLTKDFYKQTKGEGFTLDKEGKGDKVRTIQFKENEQMTNENLQKLRRETEKDETKLDTKEGIAKVEVKDKDGKIVSAKEEGAKLQEQQDAKLAKEMAEKTKENLKRKSGQSETMGAKVFDLNAEMMARRKAQELIEKRKHERIKNVA